MSKSNQQEAMSGVTDGAQPLAGPHPAPLRSRESRATRLKELDGRRIAVKLPLGAGVVVVTGLGTYEPGAGVRIRLDDEVMTEIWIDEVAWNGSILRDHGPGSDFLIALDREFLSGESLADERIAPQSTR